MEESLRRNQSDRRNKIGREEEKQQNRNELNKHLCASGWITSLHFHLICRARTPWTGGDRKWEPKVWELAKFLFRLLSSPKDKLLELFGIKAVQQIEGNIPQSVWDDPKIVFWCEFWLKGIQFVGVQIPSKFTSCCPFHARKMAVGLMLIAVFMRIGCLKTWAVNWMQSFEFPINSL